MAMHDIFDAENVTIQIDELGKRIWVCVNGETVLRCARIKDLAIVDLREALREHGADDEESARR